jgi:hypothetical protein
MKGNIMATQDKKVPVQTGGKGGNGGKTNEDMLKMGRNLAKVANQKRGK